MMIISLVTASIAEEMCVNMTTPKQFKDKCPECKSKALDYGVIEPEDEVIIQPITCKYCLYEFEIVTVPSWYIRQKNKEENET